MLNIYKLFFLFVLIVFIIILYNKYYDNLLNYINQYRIIKYKIHYSDLDHNFKNKVSEILKNSGWKKYHSIKEVDNAIEADINIYLKSDEYMEKYHKYPKFYSDNTQIRFSITYQTNNEKPYIYINAKNWINGVKQSGLSLEEYKTYVIEHEFGHALGYNHSKCNKNTQVNGICPVMYQSTIGCPNGFKCGFKPIYTDLKNKLPNRYFT